MISDHGKRRLIPALMTLVILAGSSVEGQPRRRPATDKPQTEKVSLSIILVGEELRIVSGKEVPALRKTLADQHKAEVKDWTKDKAEAKKAGTPFDDKKPVPPAFKILKAGIPSQEDAEKVRAEFQAKIEAKHKKDVRFVVTEHDGVLSVMSTTQVEETKKRLALEHKAALKDHADSKKAAVKEGKPFDLPKPDKPKFRVVSTKKYPSEAEATAALEKEQAKKAKKGVKAPKSKDPSSS